MITDAETSDAETSDAVTSDAVSSDAVFTDAASAVLVSTGAWSWPKRTSLAGAGAIEATSGFNWVVVSAMYIIGKENSSEQQTK